MKKLIVLTVMCVTLAACGVKPGSVDPPEGAEEQKFPRTYPDTRTDPPPPHSY